MRVVGTCQARGTLVSHPKRLDDRASCTGERGSVASGRASYRTPSFPAGQEIPIIKPLGAFRRETLLESAVLAFFANRPIHRYALHGRASLGGCPRMGFLHSCSTSITLVGVLKEGTSVTGSLVGGRIGTAASRPDHMPMSKRSTGGGGDRARLRDPTVGQGSIFMPNL